MDIYNDSNLLKSIGRNRYQSFNDLSIFEGFILDKFILYNKGYITNEEYTSEDIFPVYIPGKHAKIDNLSIEMFNTSDSILYELNYFEMCVKDKDTPNKPQTCDLVRIKYNKTTNRIYSVGYFTIISSNDVKNTNKTNSNNRNGTDGTTVTYSGGKFYGTQLNNFQMFTDTPIGQILLKNHNYLIYNFYGIAAQESNWYSNAIGDPNDGGSYGLFQINSSNNIDKLLTAGYDYLNLNDDKLKLYPYSKERYTSIDWDIYVKKDTGNNITKTVDIQLIAYVGYHVLESNDYIKTISNKYFKTEDDIIEFREHQRFKSNLISNYANRVLPEVSKVVSQKENIDKNLLAFTEDIKTTDGKSRFLQYYFYNKYNI